LPYRAEDIHDWPIGEDDLARHYRAVLEFMPLAGCMIHSNNFFRCIQNTLRR
jgi:hypothetical protein